MHFYSMFFNCDLQLRNCDLQVRTYILEGRNVNSETVGLVCVAGAGCFAAVAVFAGWRMNAWRRAARAARVVKVRALVAALVRGRSVGGL